MRLIGGACSLLVLGMIACDRPPPPPPDVCYPGQVCPPTPGRCASNAGCDPRSYCQFLEGQCGGPGKCVVRPEVCLQVFKPVCGCDGKTYSNSCTANAAGAVIAHDGACPPKGPFCGGIAGFPCPGRGRCDDDPTDSCDPNAGGADCGGVCVCVENVLCVQTSHFDSDPNVCNCVPN